MPSRNILRHDADASFYHVYARGSNKQEIFKDRYDFEYLVMLFERYLSDEPKKDKSGVLYPHYAGSVELLAYCQMGNHFHLLLWQRDKGGVSAFMRSLMTSYSRYFNLRYVRSGPLFESRYKSSLIDEESYLQHISRYIHLNPRYWKRYAHSSLRHYFVPEAPKWLQPGRITELFNGHADYAAFLSDYEGHKAMLDEIKPSLADV